MKQGFTLEIVNGEYMICENGRIFKRLGKISAERAWDEFENFKLWMDVK